MSQPENVTILNKYLINLEQNGLFFFQNGIFPPFLGAVALCSQGLGVALLQFLLYGLVRCSHFPYLHWLCEIIECLPRERHETDFFHAKCHGSRL